MGIYTTRIMSPGAVGALTPGGVPRDTEEGRAFRQERLAFLGRVGFILSFGFYLLANAASFLHPEQSLARWLRDPHAWSHLLTSLLLLGIWLACRGGRVSPHVLSALDAGGIVGVCLGFSLPVFWADLELMGRTDTVVEFKYAMLLGVTLTVIARAIIVPSSARRTLWISVGAVVPALAAVHRYQSALPRSGPLLLFGVVAAAYCGLAVALATVTSRVIYGLRQKVLQAMQLGQYTLQEKLGEGSMGVVYKASHAMLRRPTAIKLLPPAKAGAASLRRFEREVQLTALLTHPNTVAIYDYGRTPDGVFYYAMEYLDGVDLDHLVREEGPQSPGRVVHVMRQACGALAEAHSSGLIHRDVKPANIVLCQRGGVPDVVKVVDFGLVKELQAAHPGATSDQVIAGTPLYLAPEAITSPACVDARSDLYSLGAVGYFLLAGVHVFEGDNAVEICGHHLHSMPVPPSKHLGRPVPADLETLILSCLAKDPAHRPATARALDAALATCTGIEPWTEAQARACWQERAARSRQEAPPEPSTSSLTVDISARATAVRLG